MYYEIQIFDKELYETDADTPYISVFVKTKTPEDKIKKIVEEIQETYNKIYSGFYEIEEVVEWIKEELKEKIPDAKFMKFITIRG